MDWLKGMNQAVNYIEANVDGEISYEIAAKFVYCSLGEFQRVFSFMVGVSLSEYIRFSMNGFHPPVISSRVERKSNATQKKGPKSGCRLSPNINLYQYLSV